ncbi:MAG: hypothetical protein ACXWUZ_11280 [Allosphingosinicella sp.]
MTHDAALPDPLSEVPESTVFGPGLTLDEWMKAEGLDDAAVGELIGKDRTTVYRTRTGRYKASYDFIEAVVVASKGRVRPDSFFRKALNRAVAASPGGEAPRPFNPICSPPAPSGTSDQDGGVPRWLLPPSTPEPGR